MYHSRHILRYSMVIVGWLMFAVLIHPNIIIAQQDTTLTPDKLRFPVAETILFPVSVIDKRRNHILDLTKNDFTVLVNGQPQDIVSFNKVDEPSSICLLYDVSDSMMPRYDRESERLKITNQIPARLAAQSHESNEYFLITFNEQSNILLNGVSKDQVLEEMKNPPAIVPKGTTATYDALSLAIDKLSQATHKKRFILLITDGGADNVSRTKLSKLKEQVGTSRIPIYFLPIGGFDIRDRKMFSVMEDLVKLAGGGVFDPADTFSFHDESLKKLEEDISFIINDIRYQYTLGIKAVSSKDKWQRVKIKVNLPLDNPMKQKHILVRSQEKYYAAPHSQ